MIPEGYPYVFFCTSFVAPYVQKKHGERSTERRILGEGPGVGRFYCVLLYYVGFDSVIARIILYYDILYYHISYDIM